MRKLLLVVVLILSMIISASCTTESMSISDNIEAPENKNIPITGKWIIEDYKLNYESTISDELAKSYLDEEIIFHEKVFVLGEDYFIDPSFKTKNVNTLDYFIYQYNTNPRTLDMAGKESQIISVTKEEQLLYVFIKKSPDSLLVNINGGFFYLKKISDEVEEEKIAEYIYADKARFKAVNIEEKDISSSGALIGLKSLAKKDKANEPDSWNYRTIFIRSYNKDLISIYERPDIFLPRKTGFWNISVDRQDVEGKRNDSIIACPSEKISDLQDGKCPESYNEAISLKNILYIGNDYISIEKIDHEDTGGKSLELHLIDNLSENKPLVITDLVENIEDEAFGESSKDLTFDKGSFGLFRRNGHWIFKGRHNLVEEGENSQMDFNIKAIPPQEIVYHDKLSISWNTIKSKVPDAVDAFMSPKDDMILIITRNKILIYLIDQGKISDIPVGKIELKPGEKPIMAEWATGKHPIPWEEEFLKNGGRSIK